MPNATSDQLYTIPETAARLGCSRPHVYALIARGDLRAVNIAIGSRSRSRIRADDLVAYIERRTVKAVKAS